MRRSNGSFLVRWEQGDKSILLQPYHSLANSAPVFGQIKKFLRAHGGSHKINVTLTDDGDILLASETPASTEFVRADAFVCPDCGRQLLWRGVATICDNCGWSPGPT